MNIGRVGISPETDDSFRKGVFEKCTIFCRKEMKCHGGNA